MFVQELIAIGSENAIIEILQFLNENPTPEAKEFINWAIEIKMLPTDPCGVNHNCIQSIQTMANGLRSFHGEQGVLMADYFESVINDSNSFETMGDLQDFYDNASLITEEYNNYMFNSILFAFGDGVRPIVEMALFEVGGAFALKLLQKIPANYITTPIANIINKLLVIGSDAYASLKHAKKFGIKSYLQLEIEFATLGTTRLAEGVQFHHLIEQRFASIPAVANWIGSNTNNWKSIVLTVEEHQVFTNAWKNAISRNNQLNPGWTGAHTSTATLQQIKQAATQIYAEYPEILQILGL
ncbi:hypothetical protein N7U66_18885 [Lacinutrix neustonica]|uniref:Uncharacterized protein n=1 Tax=Lacinutrix neustonica TaxID=2980107 RepID=A0A9E8MUT7_9FLAO|nr:hypothetical protein [Lacinutrix neustonica]WAC01898.1 hypothetical protein N7U66_18885 [Lacinutrix neustonica]